MAQIPEPTASNVVDALKTKKEPPPEPPEKIWSRRLIICSFWGVALFLGLPIWWRTTTVQRANLPIQVMSDWADGKICSPSLPLVVGIEAPSLKGGQAKSLLRAVRAASGQVIHSPAHELLFTSDHEMYAAVTGHYSQWPQALTIKLAPSKGSFWSSKASENLSSSIRPQTSVLDVSWGKDLESDPNFTATLAAHVVESLQGIFAEEQAILSYLSSPSIPEDISKHLSLEVAESVARRPTRTFRYASTYHLTFSLFTPEAWPSSWEIEKALKQTVAPLLAALSPISNFTVETQVQAYATLPSSLQPIYDQNLKAWSIPRESLGGFVNAAEWPLSPSIGAGPTIHFVLYVAPPTQSPLIVESGSSNSWLVPQWGGVAIHNPKLKPGSENPVSLTSADLQPALLTFSSHLLSLLGVPSTPPQSFPVRLSTLTRVRAVSLFISASSTLGSLARLVSGLPSISIPNSVADNVSATLKHLDLACADFKVGNSAGALHNARKADAHAEKAFFEKSMVGQVYFPDEHKVAVYLPLLGPVAVPLLVAALREVKPFIDRLRGRRR